MPKSHPGVWVPASPRSLCHCPPRAPAMQNIAMSPAEFPVCIKEMRKLQGKYMWVGPALEKLSNREAIFWLSHAPCLCFFYTVWCWKSDLRVGFFLLPSISFQNYKVGLEWVPRGNISKSWSLCSSPMWTLLVVCFLTSGSSVSQHLSCQDSRDLELFSSEVIFDNQAGFCSLLDTQSKDRYGGPLVSTAEWD